MVIGNKKISHQLGAQIGTHPSSGVAVNSARKRRKTSLKKLEKHLFNTSLEKKEAKEDKQNLESISSSNDVPFSGDEAKRETSQASQPEKLPTVVATVVAKPAQVATPAVFGVSLISIMQNTGQPLPQHILEAMRFIRKVAPNEIGIFRKNGNKSRINRLKDGINKNEKINFYSDDITVFDIADTIKLYFRELPECLITNKLSDILLTNYLSTVYRKECVNILSEVYR